MAPPRPPRKREVWDPSLEDDCEYPEMLLRTAAAQTIESPVKRQKNIHKSQKSRQKRNISNPKAVSHGNGEGQERGDVVRDQEGSHGTDYLASDPWEPENAQWLPYDEVVSSQSDETLDSFIDSVSNGVVGFKHVHTKYCVVQGWDYERYRATV